MVKKVQSTFGTESPFALRHLSRELYKVATEPDWYERHYGPSWGSSWLKEWEGGRSFAQISRSPTRRKLLENGLRKRMIWLESELKRLKLDKPIEPIQVGR
jgi:hypothetical protein